MQSEKIKQGSINFFSLVIGLIGLSVLLFFRVDADSTILKYLPWEIYEEGEK